MFLDYRNETKQIGFIDYVHDKVRAIDNSRSWLLTGVWRDPRRSRPTGQPHNVLAGVSLTGSQ